MKEIFLVGAGGMIGSISRMIILKLNIYNISLPLNTFLVNIIGCFVVGILIKYSAGVSKEIAEYLNYFLIIGFCGGFTTFSAYSVDSLNLFNEDNFEQVQTSDISTTIFRSNLLPTYFLLNLTWNF